MCGARRPGQSLTVETVLLSVHVVLAIVLIGPMTVAVSLFPRYARAASGDVDSSASVAAVLHRISRAYAVLGLSVPVAGLALASRMGVLGDTWVVASLAITVAAAALLAAVVLPDQRRAMAAPRPPGARRTEPRVWAPGVFALLWVIVVVLMVARPGSTTGI
jgi:hypothetical protein